MQTVQFEIENTEQTREDLHILGISAEITQRRGCPGGFAVASFEVGRTACKLREYIESHHYAETEDGKIKTLPVYGWDLLIEAAVLH